MKYLIFLFLLPTVWIVSALPADARLCVQENCTRTYCLGPVKSIANAPVRPYTCDGDWALTLEALYWTPQLDGLEFGIVTSVISEQNIIIQQLASTVANNLVNLVDAKYLSPKPRWNFGYKLGLGYNTPCDGWDWNLLWTSFSGRARSLVDIAESDNQSLLTLWMHFDPTGTLAAVENIEAEWKLKLNLIDLEMGRESWASPRFSLRPFVGLRIAFIDQTYDIDHRGGDLNILSNNPNINNAVNNYVRMDIDFHGVGLYAGMNAAWNLGCGVSIFGDIFPSIVYGRFHINHREYNQKVTYPFEKNEIFSARDSFRGSRAIVDLQLGLRWFALYSDCKYGVGAQLAWEQHLFYDMNQFWRVKQNACPTSRGVETTNVFDQRRGSLSTSGLTLSVLLNF